MNTADWTKVLAGIPAFVTSIESAFSVSGASGQDKLNAVLSAVAPLVPAEQLATKLPVIGTYVGAIVALYNVVGFFKTNAPISTTVTAATAAVTAAVASIANPTQDIGG